MVLYLSPRTPSSCHRTEYFPFETQIQSFSHDWCHLYTSFSFPNMIRTGTNLAKVVSVVLYRPETVLNTEHEGFRPLDHGRVSVSPIWFRHETMFVGHIKKSLLTQHQQAAESRHINSVPRPMRHRKRDGNRQSGSYRLLNVVTTF